MEYKSIPLGSLVVNPANDRHGELENETAAIAQLFAMHETHMRNLAKDITSSGQVFEPPLVFRDGKTYVIADGNRRATCLKLIQEPKRAPTVELQDFFRDLNRKWDGPLISEIQCQVESDRDRIDEILFRRHTGVQGGVGQLGWDGRMKNNFVVRTGKSKGLHVADEIEAYLADANMLPPRKIPRANLNRLLSSESLRNRLGISVTKGKLDFIRDKNQSLDALKRVAFDLSERKITLEDIWSTESKRKYLDELENEGILPSLVSRAQPVLVRETAIPAIIKSPVRPAKPDIWPHLIDNLDYGIVWTGSLQRHKSIWHELQFHLELAKHPNAISVLMRVLFELSVDFYLKKKSILGVSERDSLAKKAGKVAGDMHAIGRIDEKYLQCIIKLKDGEGLISIDTLNKYVHSSHFNASPEHMKTLWNTLSNFIVECLRA